MIVIQGMCVHAEQLLPSPIHLEQLLYPKRQPLHNSDYGSDFFFLSLKPFASVTFPLFIPFIVLSLLIP